MKRWVKLSAAAVVLAIGAGGAWWHFARPSDAAVPTTVAVSRANIETTVLASGVLEASSLVSVGAEVSGRVASVNVKLGQDVKAGDLIAQLDSLEQENAVKSAEAALAGIEAQKRNQEAVLATAEAALTRAQQLSAGRLVSQADLETAQAAVDQAKAQIDLYAAQIDQAQLTVETAKLNLSRTQIVAPSDGTIVALVVEAGQTLNANSTTPTVAKIANLDTMVIKAEISEADVVKVAAGQRVYFTILGEPDSRIEAELREIEPAPTSIATDDSTTTSTSSTAIYYNGLFDVPNPEHKLRISMTAEVTIVLAEARDALVLPSSLVTRKGPDGDVMVMVYDPANERPEPRRISVGLNNNINAEILSGLEEGDQVISGMASLPAGGAGGSGQRPMGGMGGLGGPGGGGPPPMR